MLKQIVILIQLAILNSQNYIYNIEKGESKVSTYIEAMKPLKWPIVTEKIGPNDQTIKTNETISTTFDKDLNTHNPNFIPFLRIYRTKNDTALLSYNFEGCRNCLSFNYLNSGGVKDPLVDCELKIPDRDISILETNNDKYIADKILNFGDFNILYKNSRAIFTQHNGKEFTRYSQISDYIPELKTKICSLDILSYSRQFDIKVTYILCHGSDDILIFTIVKEDSGEYKFTLKFSIDKNAVGLKSYSKLCAFWVEGITILLIYRNEEIAIAKFQSTLVGTWRITDTDGTPLDIHDAKFTTMSKHQELYFIVKGKGLYFYDVKEMKVMKKIEHPYLIQFQKLSATRCFDEYVAVQVDPLQKEIKEILVEFVYNPVRGNYLEINRVYTSDNIKIFGALNVSDDFYYLYHNEEVFLLPARQPNSIQMMGEVFPLSLHDESLQIMDYAGGSGLIVNHIESGRNKFITRKEKSNNALKCVFYEADDYTVSLQMMWEIGAGAGVSTDLKMSEYNYHFTVQGGSYLMIILIVCGSIILLAIVGIVVGCYIRKRKSNQQSSNAQLL
jgi:hypothetical protein